MESTSSVNIQSLAPYRHLFPKAGLSTTRLKRNATVFDTVDTVTDAVREYAWQVQDFVEQELKGLPIYKACEKLWYFLKHHIRYKKDTPGYEQVKTGRRLISDGFGDCDDYTFFINCCMAVLKVKGVINRITKYSGNHYQHIYPLVPIGNGRYVVMDCVVDAFDYEEPYTIKKDYEIMELQILDGIDQKNTLRGVDAQDLFDEYEGVDGLSIKNLGSGIKNVVTNVASAVQNAAQNVGQNIAAAAQNVAQQVQTAVQSPKDFLHVTNIINPGTIPLRAGFLIAMKANTAAIASNIKWCYLTKEDAVSRGIDPDKYDKLKKIFDKAEEIFYTAGGDKPTLRDAILNGKGNENHEVAGLGEVASAAAIAAAAAVIGALAGLIAQVGSIFKKNDSTPPPAATPPPAVDPPATNFSPFNPDVNIDTSDWGTSDSPTVPTVSNYTNSGSSYSPGSTSPDTSMTTTTTNPPASRSETPSGGGLATFWENNKKWALPTGIGVAALGTGLVIYKVVQSKKKKGKAVNGVKGAAKSKGDKRGKRSAANYPTPVALM